MISILAIGLAFLTVISQAQSPTPPKPPSPYHSKCGQCDPIETWNDIILLIDASMPKEIVNDYVQSALGSLDIGQQRKRQSRVGVIVYNDKAHILANLSTYTKTTDFLTTNLTQFPTTKNRQLSGGVTGAIELFANSKEHRVSAPRVMIIVAQTVDTNDFAKSKLLLGGFQTDGGHVITITVGGSNVFGLASPGYGINYQNATTRDLYVNLCDANCYCPDGSFFPISSDKQDEPNDGCYSTSDALSSPGLAAWQCQNYDGGELAMPKDSYAQNFLLQSFNKNAIVYVGLFQTSKKWAWSDGTPFTGKFLNNTIAVPGDCGAIVRLNGFNTGFVTSDCAIPRAFACQIPPCSANNSCL